MAPCMWAGVPRVLVSRRLDLSINVSDWAPLLKGLLQECETGVAAVETTCLKVPSSCGQIPLKEPPLQLQPWSHPGAAARDWPHVAPAAASDPPTLYMTSRQGHSAASCSKRPAARRRAVSATLANASALQPADASALLRCCSAAAAADAPPGAPAPARAVAQGAPHPARGARANAAVQARTQRRAIRWRARRRRPGLQPGAPLPPTPGAAHLAAELAGRHAAARSCPSCAPKLRHGRCRC
eukprot:364461-Chlamydomonas_euryale.AAC.2